MSILFALCPWIAYAVVSSFLPVAPSVLIAAAVSAVVVAARLRRGSRPAELIIDMATAAFFLVAAAVAVVNATVVRDLLGAGSQLWLAVVVGVGLVVGRPFTEAIARRQVPAEVAGAAGFHRFNVRITTAGLLSFLVAGIVLGSAVLLLGPSGRYFTYALLPLSILIPVRYTARIAGAGDAV